jgi:hypothetical protein
LCLSVCYVSVCVLCECVLCDNVLCDNVLCKCECWRGRRREEVRGVEVRKKNKNPILRMWRIRGVLSMVLCYRCSFDCFWWSMMVINKKACLKISLGISVQGIEKLRNMINQNREVDKGFFFDYFILDESLRRFRILCWKIQVAVVK